jgi:hypothetical protein
MTYPATIITATDNSEMVFAEPSGQLYRDIKLSPIYRDFAKTTKSININSN